MQETRWGDLMVVWQAIYDDIKSNKVNIILNKNQVELATQSELLDLGKKFGFDFTQLTGYTSTLDYLRKEVYTIPTKLKNKTALPSYQMVGVPFNLNSTAYPVASNTIVGILVVDEGGTVAEIKSLKYLDDTFSGSTTTTDALNFPNLDASDYAYDYTRRLVFSYIHNTVENENEFLSLNTLKVLNKDVTLNSKLTDRCIFEPFLKTKLFPGGKLYVQEWKDYTGTVKAYQSSTLTGDLNNLYKVRFGNGNHYIEDSTLTTLRNKIKSSYLFNTTDVSLDSSMNGNNLNITNFYDECDFYWNGVITHLTNSSNKLYSKGAYYLSTSSISTSDAYMFDGLYNASNWTIEARIKLNTGLTSAGSLLWATSASGVGFKIDFTNGDTNAMLTFYVSSTGSSYNIQAGSYGSDYMTLDQYHHLVLTFDGSIYRLYLDGKLQVSASSALKMIRLNQLNFIGQAGYLDEFRISKNVRYTGSTFTPPTALLTKDSDVLSLFRWNGVVPSEADIDLNYNFEGTLTDVIKDSGKKKAHGIPNNIISGLGVTGNCAVFDGSSSYIKTNGLTTANIINTRFTIMTRTYIDSAGDTNAPIISFNDNNGGARIEVNSTNGNITFVDTNHGIPIIPTGTVLATGVNRDIFVSLIIVADSTNLYFYVDNVLKSTTALTGALQPDPEIIIGKKTLTSGPWFRGKMDSFWIIDRDLTADERSSLYNSDNFTTPKPYGPDLIFPKSLYVTFPKPVDLTYSSNWALNIKYKFNTVPASSGKIFQFGTHHFIENGTASRFYINDGSNKCVVDIPGTGNGKWHSFTISYDASTHLVTTVSDGVSLGTTSVSSYTWSNPTDFNIGSASSLFPAYRGSIDQLCVFNDKLTVAEMQNLQNNVDVSKLTNVADVKSYLFERIISTECDTLTSIEGTVFRTKMNDTTFPAISEIAGFDSGGNYLFYTHFPTIQWDDKMLSNIKLQFTNIGSKLVTNVTEDLTTGIPEISRKALLFLKDQVLSNTRSNKLFDGLNQSFYKNTASTDPYISAQYGRVYSQHMAHDIMGKIVQNKFTEAKSYIATVINIMKDEDTKGFNGVLHMGYNTIIDDYVDPRGNFNGVLQMLRAILIYMYLTKDFTHMDYMKTKLDWLLTQQISGGIKDGLFMSGLANTALPVGDVNFGYQTYSGNPNTQMNYSYTEDNALALFILKWAVKLTKDDKDLTKHDNYLASYNKIVASFSKFWSTDHYIAGIDDSDTSNTGMNVGANLWGFFTQFNPKDKTNIVNWYNLLNYIYTNYTITASGYKGLKQFNGTYSDEYYSANAAYDTTISVPYTLMYVIAAAMYISIEDQVLQASKDRVTDILTKANELCYNMINLRDNITESGNGSPLASSNTAGVLTTVEGTLSANLLMAVSKINETGTNLVNTYFGMYV